MSNSIWDAALPEDAGDIESFDYNGLYNHLISNLPHSETRNYVVKVTQRREKYLK